MASMTSPRIVIARYRAKAGSLEALHALCATHYARLYVQGLVTRRPPLLMCARDGSVIEVLEWKSQADIDAAHTHPGLIALWREYAQICDYAPLQSLPEAAELFAGFESAPFEVVTPPFYKVVNHVQVNARISTSGKISAEVVEEMARQGYAGVINLLPDSSPHALADEAQLVQQQALAYDHIPVDFAAPTADDYDAFERALDGFRHDQRVFVHCAANMRVSVFMAIYGSRRFGWSPARAAQHIAEVWKPNEPWQAFLRAQLAPE